MAKLVVASSPGSVLETAAGSGVVTMGIWTDAWPVRAGEQWAAEFSAPLSKLSEESC